MCIILSVPLQVEHVVPVIEDDVEVAEEIRDGNGDLSYLIVSYKKLITPLVGF